MPVWGPGFEVSLDFYIHSLLQGNSNGFSWVFAMRCSIPIILDDKLVNIDTIFLISNEDPDWGKWGIPGVWMHASGYLNIMLPNIGQFSSDFIQIKRWHKLIISSLQEDSTVSCGQYI